MVLDGQCFYLRRPKHRSIIPDPSDASSLPGQREILQSLHTFAEKQEQEAIAAAKEQGIELVFDEGEEGA